MKTNDLTSGVVASMRKALNRLADGEVECALVNMEELETSIRDFSIQCSESEYFEAKHLLMWSMLHRAVALSEISDLESSRAVLESVLTEIRTQESAGRHHAGCFCQEHITASIELAKVMAGLGLFNAAIIKLVALDSELERLHRMPLQSNDDSLVALVGMWGDYLGYETLDSRLKMKFRGTTKAAAINDSNYWVFPIPLRGEAHNSYKDRSRALLQQASDHWGIDYEALQGKSQLIREQLEGWIRAAPYSVEANEQLIKFLFAESEHAIETDDYDHFVEIMESTNPVLSQIVNEHSNNVFLLLKVARWLCSLSRKIAYHDYETEELYQHYYWFGANCLESARNVLQAIEETSAITQAIGLRECIATNLYALESEMISKFSDALYLRGRRDRILSEILFRDPDNDLANQLAKEYAQSAVPMDPEVERDIANWNWSIVPL